MITQGVLKAFNSGTYLASVQVVGSLGTWLANVPVSRGIASAEMVVGRRVALAMFDEANPTDAAIIAVWP